MRTLLLSLLLLATACDSASDRPTLMDARASCVDADGSWRLEADVEHDGGADRVITVHFDLEILLINGDSIDSQYIGSHSLDHQGEGLWALDLPLGTTQLQCGFEAAYRLTITAEDDDGDQSAAAIQVDGYGNRVD
mgnify:CR=1 FL=1